MQTLAIRNEQKVWIEQMLGLELFPCQAVCVTSEEVQRILCKWQTWQNQRSPEPVLPLEWMKRRVTATAKIWNTSCFHCIVARCKILSIDSIRLISHRTRIACCKVRCAVLHNWFKTQWELQRQMQQCVGPLALYTAKNPKAQFLLANCFLDDMMVVLGITWHQFLWSLNLQDPMELPDLSKPVCAVDLVM